MKKTARFFLGIILLSSSAYSQLPKIETEQWAEKPVIHKLDPKYNNESAVVLLDKRRVEYADEGKDEIGEYYTLHKIIRVNDDRGIEYFNKIYLGMNGNADMIDVKARSIQPSGKIIELDKSNIKDLKEEDDNVYKIFAMEGLEKGSEIEFFYTTKRQVSYFGREVVQSMFPVLESSFDIIAPERLQFEVKPYNCSPLDTDTVLNGKKIIHCSLKEIAGAEREKYASYEVNLGRFEYKLSYNNATRQGERLFTWNDLAKRIYTLYTSYNEKELKRVADLVRDNKWDKIGDEPGKIRAVENYIKKNIATRDDLGSDDAGNIEKILKNKISSTPGAMRLYGAIFQNLGVNYQFVLAGNRNNFILDKGFENWNNCDYPLFYFPAEDKYLAPTRADFRYPWILPSWGVGNALFCKGTSIGNFTTAIAEIKPIALEDYKESYNSLQSSLSLNATLDTLLIDMKMIYGGYAAVGYRDGFNFASDDEKQRNLKALVRQTVNSENILSSEIQNEDFEDADKPFILHTRVKSAELLERAGNKLLVKIGMVIGPQVEMYQEKPRQFAVSMEFPHFEERTIQLTIPDGYAIKNPGDVKIDQTFRENGELTMGFVSSYEQKGNTLSVHIMEEYHKTDYPLSQYETFKKIINASSDFNKIVLVLEKK